MAGPSLKGIVNPELLAWAREASRLDVETAAQKIGVAPEKLVSWEDATAEPTITQLRKLADTYRRAVTFFFLERKPRAAKRLPDFRRLELSADDVESPELANMIREAQAKRAEALNIFAESEDTPPEFLIALDRRLRPEAAAVSLRAQLGIEFQQQRGWFDEYQALRAWKAAAEARGVMVLQSSGVSIDEMRGCAIAEFPLPVVILNGSDRPLGRIFTLLHELVHLAHRESALCDMREQVPRNDEQERIEAYCNHVAGAVLVPAEFLNLEADVRSANAQTVWDNEQLSRYRRQFWASRETVLRRLLILGRTSAQFYRRMRNEFVQQYANQIANTDIIVPVHRRVLMRNGDFLTSLALGAYDAGVLTGSALARVLGTKLEHVPKIITELRSRLVA
jgi:Zn-dependent peptidase ImmA (M78 family)/transcriptional regulator with XRE-family HTH domain